MKKIKRILSLVLIATLSLGVIVAYSNVSADNGTGDAGKCKEIVKNYVDYVIDGKYKDAAGLFENVNVDALNNDEGNKELRDALLKKLDIKEEELDEDSKKELDDVVTMIVDAVKKSKDIKDPKTNEQDKTYTVEYIIEYPDIEKVMKAYVGFMSEKFLELAGEELDAETKLTAIKKIITEEKTEKLSQKFVVTLKETENGIKIISDKKVDE